MILASRARSLWETVDRHLPEVCWLFMTYRALIGHRRADSFLRDIYPGLPVTDLTRDILQVVDGLAVVPMLNAGWSDRGVRDRLFRAIDNGGDFSALLARIEGSTQPATSQSLS